MGEPRYVMVSTTVETEADAQRLAAAVVEERLAACVQALPVRSTYRWQGRVHTESPEILLLAKTPAARAPALLARLRALHSYELPELVVTPIVDGSPGYLAWLDAETDSATPPAAGGGVVSENPAPTGDAPARSVGLVATQVVELALPAEGFVFESGARLPVLQVAYETYGALTPNRDNAVFVCHALSGDAHVAGYHDAAHPERCGWWEQMVGPGKGIDTDHYFVICANVLGGCKGTTGPGSTDPATGRPYGSAFPRLTVGDMVAVHRLLVRQLGVERLAAVVGGSFGGMQALEWCIRYPDMVDRCICIASGASLSAQALAFDIVGRLAITGDPDWQGGDYYASGRVPARGLAQARQIGHITYLSPEMMTRKFGRERREAQPAVAGTAGVAATVPFRTDFQVESYLAYQGRKFVERFDANSYLEITRAMDEFDLVERFGTLEAAFAPLRAKCLVVALSSDWLFPPEQSAELANALVRAGKPVSTCLLSAPHGHDAFLVDIAHLAEVLRAFLPWVNRGVPRVRPRAEALPAARSGRGAATHPHAAVAELVPPGSRVLDLGCGRGDLLSLLRERGGGGVALGVDIDLGNLVEVLDRGHDVLQADIDAGLALIPDGAYDYAVLEDTLQVMRNPRFVLHEMLRVARYGILTFPNFGTWTHRLQLLLHGRMPKGGALPFEWYETPNIHLFTLRDFRDLCGRDAIHIHRLLCLPGGGGSRLLIRLGLCNLGAGRVVMLLGRHAPAAGARPCTCGRGRALTAGAAAGVAGEGDAS